MPEDCRHSAAARAAALVESTQDDPVARLHLIRWTYLGPFGRAPRHLPFRRAALSFTAWQLQRGLLEPAWSAAPGSPWWRAVNERLLRDQCEAVFRSGGLGGAPSSATIALWSAFIAEPTAARWYRAHNASVIAGYLDNEDLARQENEAERFFLNVVLGRVLYAHALVAAPRLALGRLAALGPLVGDPRLGAVGVFLSLGRVLPDRYPAVEDVDTYIRRENGLARLLDYGVISARMQSLYEWSAVELDQPALADLVQDGAPRYAWPLTSRRVWRSPRPTQAERLLQRVTAP